MINQAKHLDPREDHEEVSNNIVSHNQSELSRRDVLVMGALTASTLFASNAMGKAASQTPSPESTNEPYVARDFNALLNKKLEGLSQNQLSQHLKLYQGYVKKANEISRKLIFHSA